MDQSNLHIGCSNWENDVCWCIIVSDGRKIDSGVLYMAARYLVMGEGRRALEGRSITLAALGVIQSRHRQRLTENAVMSIQDSLMLLISRRPYSGCSSKRQGN